MQRSNHSIFENPESHTHNHVTFDLFMAVLAVYCDSQCFLPILAFVLCCFALTAFQFHLCGGCREWRHLGLGDIRVPSLP